MNPSESKATAAAETAGDAIVLKIGGAWRLTESLPQLDEVMPAGLGPRPVRVVPEQLAEWDTSLPLFLLRVRSWCGERKAGLDLDPLPDSLKRLFRLISESAGNQPDFEARRPELRPVLAAARRSFWRWKDSVSFLGECAIAALEVPADTRRFSWKDCFGQMVAAGPQALPIVGLLSFVIGVTFAFQTILQLRDFGAQIYVINAVGLAVVREIGPLTAAVVLAGRTGAAFAARLGDMKLGGEIDALEMLGVSPVQFLVLPRVVALALMLPTITLYSDLLGVLGGLLLNIPAAEFWTRLTHAVTLTDLNVGIVKAILFGLLIGLAGTWRGLQSERSSAGVGRAVTSAVVTGITSIILADALFAPVLRNLNF